MFKINKTVLNSELKRLGGIKKNNVNPIADGLKIATDKEKLFITSTNFDVTVRISTDEVEVEQDAGFVVDEKIFKNIINKLPNKAIHFSLDNGKLIIKSGKSRFSLNTMDVTEYPLTPSVNGKTITIKYEDLLNVFNKTSYCVSKMDTRPILTGVQLNFSNGKLKGVATDAHRLSKIINDVDDTDKSEIDIVLPSSSIKGFATIFEDEEVDLTISESQILIEGENTIVISRLLTGNFPDTDRLIPNSYTTLVTVDKEPLREALERGALLADKDMNIIRLVIGGGDNEMFESVQLTQSKSELGESSEEVIVDSVEGEDLTISFNPDYLIDILKNTESEQVEIEFSGGNRPFVVKGKDEFELLQLMLPVRTF